MRPVTLNGWDLTRAAPLPGLRAPGTGEGEREVTGEEDGEGRSDTPTWTPMIGEHRQLITDFPVEWVWEITSWSSRLQADDPISLRGNYGVYPNLIKENLRMSTCNRLTWQTLGSQPAIMPKNLPHQTVSHRRLRAKSTWTTVLPLQYDAFGKHKRRHTIKVSFSH